MKITAIKDKHDHSSDCGCALFDAKRIDPTQTTGIRKAFEADLVKRFRTLKGLIRQALVVNDVLGLRKIVAGIMDANMVMVDASVPAPRAFAFNRSDEKVSQFMQWLTNAEDLEVFEVAPGTPITSTSNAAWANKYVESAYQRGIKQSTARLVAEGANVAESWVVNAFTRPIHADRLALAYTRTFTELKGITDVMDQQISRILANGVGQGKNPLEIAREINDRVDKIGITRARVLARTECLIGETIVDSAEIKSAHKRWYEGEVFEIITNDGRNITTTPNHPMLTQRGWIFACEISDTDYLVCDPFANDSGAPRHENINNGPSSIAEIFDSISTIGIIERKGAGKPDFHGDGMDGYVDIASPDGELHIGKFSPVYEHSLNFFLSESNRAGTRFCSLTGRLLPVDERIDIILRAPRNSSSIQPVGDCSLADAILNRQLMDRQPGFVLFANQFGRKILNVCRNLSAAFVKRGKRLRVISENSFISDLVLNPSKRVSEALADLIARKVFFIHPDDSILVSSGAGFALVRDPVRLLSGSDDTSIAEPLCHGVGTETNDFANFCGGHSGSVHLDRVIKINRRLFSGHVYNLSTVDGYFTIHGGAYTGNTISAHAEASLNTYEEAGIEGVDVEAEVLNAVDACPICVALAENGPYTIAEARGMIPGRTHPGCKCALAPKVINGTGIQLI